jgi:uncharacterized delta-60 repeat protein
MPHTNYLRPYRASLFVSLALIFSSAVAALSQSALDGFDPNASALHANGTVRAIVVQPDGKILIGGDFTTLAPNGGAAVTCSRIARLNPDGMLDTSFNAGASASVDAIALDAGGNILVGGHFSGTRHHLARLTPTGSIDLAFDPDVDGPVLSIVVLGNGRILIGGSFSHVHNEVHNNLARLNAAGLPDSFPGAIGQVVNAIAVQPDGKILVGGAFKRIGIGGQPHFNLARLDATGTAGTFPNAIGGQVNAIALQADGSMLVGGAFFNIGGQSRSKIARLNVTTGLPDSFNPNANGQVNAITVQPDGDILVGGDFTEFTPTGGAQVTRNHIARLNLLTGLADSFDPNIDPNINPHATAQVNAIAVQQDGKILVGGDFTKLAPMVGTAVTRNHIARLEIDGRLDRTLNLSTVGSVVYAIAVQPNGKILIGGSFTTVLGVPRNNIARLNTDGTLDMAFDPKANGQVNAIAVHPDGNIWVGGAFSNIGGQPQGCITRLDGATGSANLSDLKADGQVNALAVQADGKMILVGGDFGTIGGQPRFEIARLDAANGSVDLMFNPTANGRVSSIAVEATGNILVGGNFTKIAEKTHNYIARLKSAGDVDDSFDPNPSFVLYTIAVQTDTKILIGGGFATLAPHEGAPVTCKWIARLNPDGTLDTDTDFNQNTQANNIVYSIAVQTDGKILAGGVFSSIGGQTSSNGIARLKGTTGLADDNDDKFSPSANGDVFSIAIQADGKILAGGVFSSIGGQPRRLFARLSNHTAALQNLAVRQTAITWTRGGSGPQFTRVTFESSTDNVSFTPLGIGTAAGSDWILTGLNLPTGRNIFVRARGYYRSGYVTGSESITESVRNAFF